MARIPIDLMRQRIASLAVAAACFAMSTQAAAAVKVFACEPEWAALAREIGGERVQAYSATHARQDPHHIRARPSLVAKIRRADLLFCSGAGLEVGWLPLLLRRGGGAAVQPGAIGHLIAANHIAAIEKPAVLDRSLGDIHPEGNPHFHLDPNNILSLAGELRRRLAVIDPPGKAHYDQRYGAFKASWSAAMPAWEQRASALADAAVVVHHKFWSYFLRWAGLREAATLEAKPGIPPSAGHLNNVLSTVRAENVRAVLRTPYDDAKPSEWLSGRTGIPALELPATVDRGAQPGSLKLYFDDLLSRLESAVGRR